ncbi:MAG: hypothetical protein AAF684_11075, partial [Pseudomonadota bacterium]
GLIVAFCAVAASTPATAQTLDGYLNSPNHRAVTQQIIDAYEGPRRGGCRDTRIIGTKATVLDPVRFSGDGAPLSGVWREATVIDRCGRRVRHNVTFIADNGVLTPLGMAPGDTRVGQADQDALATMAVNRLHERAPKPNCDAFVIFDTAASGPSGAPGRSWRETWTIDRCGDRDAVRFTLQIDGDQLRARYTDP